ncbi:MAG: hypothetical protein NTW08_07505 [Gammaproteobacteria bacterium]|nr:hypothetical protein [Gammaproteobacteria bacterium]
MPFLPTLDHIIATVIQDMQKEPLDLHDQAQTDIEVKQRARALILSMQLEQSFSLQVSHTINELKALYTRLNQHMQTYPWLELNQDTLKTIEQHRRVSQETFRTAIACGKQLSRQIDDIESERFDFEEKHGLYDSFEARLQALNEEIHESQSAYPQITPELIKKSWGRSSNDVPEVKRYLANTAFQLMQSAQTDREQRAKLLTQERIQNNTQPDSTLSEGPNDIPSIKKYFAALTNALKTRKRLEQEKHLLTYLENLKAMRASLLDKKSQFDTASEKASNELQGLNQAETTIKSLLTGPFQQNPHQMLQLQLENDALLKQLDQREIHTTGVTTFGHFATKHRDPEQVNDLTDTLPMQSAVR